MWPFRKKDSGPSAESVQAKQRAEEALRESRETRVEAEQLVGRMRVFKEDNHFAENIRAFLEGSKT